MLCNDLNAQTFLSWQKQLIEQFYLFYFLFRHGLDISFTTVNWRQTLPTGTFSYISDSVESSYQVVWLGVKPVGALVMENRCGNGLALLLYPPAAFAAVMKNNGFIPEGRGPQVTPLPLLPLLPTPVHSDSAGKPTDDWAGSHLASVHLV